jgi:hypothetical protein
MLSKLHSLILNLCSNHYNKNFILHPIVAPQLSSGWRHNYSTKTRPAGSANEQSMYSLMSFVYETFGNNKSFNMHRHAKKNFKGISN